MFCPKCSENLKFNEEKYSWYCPKCGFNGQPEMNVKMNKGSPCVC